ncbi:hypothetical protein C8R44DRAFT_813453 [Mycena epipterygia]|nr:hypothetical protein C8R44DRAFT_813453 [Mycena epipterygia]
MFSFLCILSFFLHSISCIRPSCRTISVGFNTPCGTSYIALPALRRDIAGGGTTGV